MNNLVRKAMHEFKGAFINYNNELILVPRTNLYFLLNDVKRDFDVNCKLLEWCSRDACKSMPYYHQWRNDKYNNEVLEHINSILETSFTHEQMELIYTRLGNGCNHLLTIKFVESNYDMKILKAKQ